METESGSVRIYLRNDDTVVFDSNGVDLKFEMLHWGYGTELGEKEFQILSGVYNTRAMFAVESGIGVADGPCHLGNGGKMVNQKRNLKVSCENGRIRMAMSLSVKEPNDIVLPLCPDREIAAVSREWEAFLAEMEERNAIDPETDNFVRVTWYNLWSSFVRAQDNYPNDTMLMSKKKMTSTWSWDHCFNALAMAHLKDKALAKEKALDQFMAPFALQTSKGCLPDMWNPELETRWGTTKPPIHGWCFSLLMVRSAARRIYHTCQNHRRALLHHVLQESKRKLREL